MLFIAFFIGFESDRCCVMWGMSSIKGWGCKGERLRGYRKGDSIGVVAVLGVKVFEVLLTMGTTARLN